MPTDAAVVHSCSPVSGRCTCTVRRSVFTTESGRPTRTSRRRLDSKDYRRAAPSPGGGSTYGAGITSCHVTARAVESQTLAELILVKLI